MTAIIARIALRYAADALVAAGYLDAELGQQIGADPDLLIIIGGALGVGVELAFAFAKKTRVGDMIGLLDAIKIGAGAILGGALNAGPIYLTGKPAGRQEAAAIAAAEAINRIQELEKNSASFRDLPSRDRCLILMRDSGLPDSECDQR